MTCIYDVLLNFTDENRVIEFFEWNDKDILEHVKKVLLFRVTTEQLKDIVNYKIKVSTDFLTKIEDKTILYNNDKKLRYVCLFSDLNKVIGVEFNSKGESVATSSLLLDEEDDIISECFYLEEEKIDFEKLSKYLPLQFLTRKELFRKNYLLHEVKELYLNKNFIKLEFLYQELYGRNKISIEEKYQKIIFDLTTNYNEKHDALFDIVRLTYMKK